MKKAMLVVLLALVPMISHGAGYIIGDFGTGGEIHGPSYGIELGGIFLSPLHPRGGAFSVGMGVSVADTDDDPTSTETILQTTSRKDLNDGNETEVHATFGAEIVPALFGIVGIGYSSQDITVTGVATGQRYKIDTKTDNNVTGLFGIRYVRQWMNLGVGYHTRRGIMASIGFAF
jgi:hypothetical protein